MCRVAASCNAGPDARCRRYNAPRTREYGDVAAGERPFLDRTLSQLRQERLAAVAAWRAAGGSWAPGERPTHPTLFAVVEDLEHRYYDLSASLLPPDPDGLLRRLRERDRDAVEEAIS